MTSLASNEFWMCFLMSRKERLYCNSSSAFQNWIIILRGRVKVPIDSKRAILKPVSRKTHDFGVNPKPTVIVWMGEGISAYCIGFLVILKTDIKGLIKVRLLSHPMNSVCVFLCLVTTNSFSCRFIRAIKAKVAFIAILLALCKVDIGASAFQN